MHRHARKLAVAIGGLAVALVAGCAAPDGIDGDLTAGWGTMPEPVGWVPDAGTCHPGDFRISDTLVGYRPVDCQQQHTTETAHVGEFTGEAAERVTPPPEGSPQWRQAYTECDEAAASYLGADFRHGHLWLGVTIPSVAAWEGGARWFRCELEQYDVHRSEVQTRLGSLARALEVESDLLLRCFEATLAEDPGDVEEMLAVLCDEPHDSEFVGVWVAPEVPYPDGDDERSSDLVLDGCREQVAEYVDVPVDGNLVFRTGTISYWMSQAEWDNGDRGFRCYLYLADEGLTGSLEGAGTVGLPIR